MEAKDTAVIVVDMQKCFANKDGSLYSESSSDIIEPINTFINKLREDGSEIVFTKDTHTKEQFEELENYDEFERWGEHAIKGEWEHELVDGLDVHDSDIVIEKDTYDAFHKTKLDEKLEGIKNVIVVGTLVNVCVLHTASSAALHDYDTRVIRDLVGYIEEDDKEYALDHIDWLFGEVESSQEYMW